jgi:hypothetical protein
MGVLGGPQPSWVRKTQNHESRQENAICGMKMGRQNKEIQLRKLFIIAKMGQTRNIKQPTTEITSH